MTENDNDTDVTIELYRGETPEPSATVEPEYPWLARQSDRALVESITAALAEEEDLQKTRYRLFLLENGTEPIHRQWQAFPDVDEDQLYRELQMNVQQLLLEWRVQP